MLILFEYIDPATVIESSSIGSLVVNISQSVMWANLVLIFLLLVIFTFHYLAHTIFVLVFHKHEKVSQIGS